MTVPRLDIDTWEMADGRLAGEIADAGQIGPFEEFMLRSLLVNRRRPSIPAFWPLR